MAETSPRAPLDVRTFNFWQRHIYFYSSQGKTMNRDGVHVWSMTGEPIGSGDVAHHNKVIEALYAAANKETDHGSDQG